MAIHMEPLDVGDLMSISTQEKIDILKQAIKRIITDRKIGMCDAIRISIFTKYNRSIYVYYSHILFLYPDFNYANYVKFIRNNKPRTKFSISYWDKRNIFGNIRRILFLRKLIKNLKKTL